MDIRINIEECVNENTQRYGIGKLNEISSSKIQKQLVQIEEYFQQFYINQKKLSEQVKEYSKLSILSVSSNAKVSRSQINLNTNTLKLYIENRIKEIEKKDILNTKKHERLKGEKRELGIYLDGLRQQIADSFELKLRIEMLESENKRLILQLESRHKDVRILEEENRKLRKTFNNQNKEKIVPFN
ncbi:hypothetical protein [Niallia taxi]|uniref:hypothetical protein n=1 Tax=Niallia taxi TaxID=2499688 RepID=UPI003D2C351C